MNYIIKCLIYFVIINNIWFYTISPASAIHISYNVFNLIFRSMFLDYFLIQCLSLQLICILYTLIIIDTHTSILYVTKYLHNLCAKLYYNISFVFFTDVSLDPIFFKSTMGCHDICIRRRQEAATT